MKMIFLSVSHLGCRTSTVLNILCFFFHEETHNFAKKNHSFIRRNSMCSCYTDIVNALLLFQLLYNVLSFCLNSTVSREFLLSKYSSYIGW
uniref:Uncharacterized protein n=1 Tax=Arundo donax TaxID=35708 RepID=A0A0A9EAM8_ARUDO